MKINANNARSFVRHTEGLQQLTDLSRSGIDLYLSARRLELKAQRVNTAYANGKITSEQREQEGRKIAEKVRKLFPFMQWVEACRGDVRGYAITFERKQAEDLRMVTAMDREGILAPEF